MWFFFWVAIMLGLVIATTVVAMREKKARQAALQKMNPQPLGASSVNPMASVDDGFGQQDPLAGFDGDAASFDDATFK